MEEQVYNSLYIYLSGKEYIRRPIRTERPDSSTKNRKARVLIRKTRVKNLEYRTCTSTASRRSADVQALKNSGWRTDKEDCSGHPRVC